MRPANSAFVRGRLDALPGIVLRPIETGDMDFLCALYAGTREAELAPVPWTAEQKHAFLNQQFELQHRHYHAAYTDAEFLLIIEGGKSIGRIYLERSKQRWSLIDIALIPARRGHGIGTALLAQMLDEARAACCEAELHVETCNPARRLYERSGFRLAEHRDVYDLLVWSS